MLHPQIGKIKTKRKTINERDSGSFQDFKRFYVYLVDELHGLAMGRNIIKNLHGAGNQGMAGGLQTIVCDYKEPLYDVNELRAIAPTDLKQHFDIRTVIARIVDGSEFDEFKKLYGTVRSFVFLETIFIVFVYNIL